MGVVRTGGDRGIRRAAPLDDPATPLQDHIAERVIFAIRLRDAGRRNFPARGSVEAADWTLDRLAQGCFFERESDLTA
ncbi:MAG: hypothetical protein JWN86_2494 [Planctomycetota bacterium]|nr:hypothetical protein [Planctomycetota bacterium]